MQRPAPAGLIQLREPTAAGDKQRSFVGSSQWIGAIELGYVLDTLLGITSRVITVSDGADMDQTARQIAQHFDTQVGTAMHRAGQALPGRKPLPGAPVLTAPASLRRARRS